MAARIAKAIAIRLVMTFSDRSPAWAIAMRAKYPPNEPAMKISPWAKLIMRRMP